MNYPMPCSWPWGHLWRARGGQAGIQGRRAASSRELSKFKLCQNNFHPSIKKNKSSRGRIWSHGGSVGPSVGFGCWGVEAWLSPGGSPAGLQKQATFPQIREVLCRWIVLLGRDRSRISTGVRGRPKAAKCAACLVFVSLVARCLLLLLREDAYSSASEPEPTASPPQPSCFGQGKLCLPASRRE